MSQEPSDQPGPVAKLFGGLFMAAGVLIMGLAGLCSGAFVVMAFSESGNNGLAGLAMVPVVGLIGGVPFALGLGAFLIGRLLWRGPKRPKPTSVDTFN